MRYSMRQLLLYMTGASVLLALSQLPLLIGGTALILGIVIAYVCLPTGLWRCIAYGSVLGMILTVAAVATYLALRFSPVVGYGTSLAGGDRWAMASRLQSVVLPLGTLLGGTTGLLIWKSFLAPRGRGG